MADDREEAPASPPPPDPFLGIDVAYATIVSQIHGLQRNGASLLEASLFAASLAVITGMANQAQPPAE